MYVANNSGAGSMIVSGGTFNQTGGSFFRIGAGSGTGTLTVSGTGALSLNSEMWIGYSGPGTLNLSGGSIAQSGQYFVLGTRPFRAL